MNNFCLDCKHWRRNTDNYRSKLYGKCHCLKLFNGYSKKQEDFPLDGLVAWQGTGLYAVLETGQYFGCNHYVAKD